MAVHHPSITPMPPGLSGYDYDEILEDELADIEYTSLNGFMVLNYLLLATLLIGPIAIVLFMI